MKVITDHGLYRKIEEFEYNPTPEELLYYYSGTSTQPSSSSWPHHTPYSTRSGASARKIRYVKVNDKGEMVPEQN